MSVVATDDFGSLSSVGLNSPASKGVDITPSATDELAKVSRGLFVGVAGDVRMILKNDAASSVWTLGVGVWPFRVRQVLVTDTTASGLKALY